MTHVVTDNCTDCRFTRCVSVCPVECFHHDDRMVYIDPNVCIDCGGCVTECPVEAIFDGFDLSDDDQHWVEMNRLRSLETPLLISSMDPLPTADAKKLSLGK